MITRIGLGATAAWPVPGTRGHRTQPPGASPPPAAPPSSSPSHIVMPAEPTGLPACQSGPSAAELFSRLFPDGVQMTGELFADLEQLLRLTSKLTAGGNGTAR